jgi:hypothetical protein
MFSFDALDTTVSIAPMDPVASTSAVSMNVQRADSL